MKTERKDRIFQFHENGQRPSSWVNATLFLLKYMNLTHIYKTSWYYIKPCTAKINFYPQIFLCGGTVFLTMYEGRLQQRLLNRNTNPLSSSLYFLIGSGQVLIAVYSITIYFENHSGWSSMRMYKTPNII